MRRSHYAPWHFLYFLPLPHGHGSLRPTFGSGRTNGSMGSPSSSSSSSSSSPFSSSSSSSSSSSAIRNPSYISRSRAIASPVGASLPISSSYSSRPPKIIDA